MPNIVRRLGHRAAARASFDGAIAKSAGAAGSARGVRGVRRGPAPRTPTVAEIAGLARDHDSGDGVAKAEIHVRAEGV